VSLTESDTIYDYCWYPKMSSANPVTCWWVWLSRSCQVGGG